MIEKITQGKVAKRLNEICLLSQVHMAEEGGPVVQKHLDKYAASIGSKLSLERFRRWTLGQSEKEN